MTEDTTRLDEDAALAAAVIRNTIVRTYHSTSLNFIQLVLVTMAIGYLTLKVAPDAGVQLILFGPLAAAVFMRICSYVLQWRVSKRWAKVSVWEKRRINAVIEKLGKDGVKL